MSSGSRRSSITSFTGSIASLNVSVVGKKWFDNYLNYQRRIVKFDVECVFDILKDVTDETNEIYTTIHMLSLLEQFHWVYEKIDSLELCVEWLTKIFQTQKNVDIKCKLLFTNTTLLLCNFDKVERSAILENLLQNFIVTVIKLSNERGRILGVVADECLRQFEEFQPGIFNNLGVLTLIPTSNLLLQSLFLRNHLSGDPRFLSPSEPINQFLETLSASKDTLHSYRLHQILVNLYKFLQPKTSRFLSPLIFKSYIPLFINSTEIYYLHFNLLLLRSFGMELFSTAEEQTLLTRLIVLCSHPALKIHSRYLYLDFALSLIAVLRTSSNFDQQSLEPSALDDFNAIEKKLAILNEFELSDNDILLSLKSIQESHEKRSAMALYRLLYAIIGKRPSMTRSVENLLISLMITHPRNHLRPALNFIQTVESLKKNVISTFVKKLLARSDAISDEPEDFLRFYFGSITWFLTQSVLTQGEIVELLRFCLSKAQEKPIFVRSLLSVCSTLIRNQIVGDEMRQMLREILQFLIGVKKEETVSSWAQIYLIAIDNLPGAENLRQVFAENFDVEDEKSIVFDQIGECPLHVERMFTNEHDEIDDFGVNLTFKISRNVDVEARFERLFAIEVNFSCDWQNVDETVVIPFLAESERIHHLTLRPAKISPFTLTVNVSFCDANGFSYFLKSIHHETIVFRDFLVKCDFDEVQFRKLWSELQVSGEKSTFLVTSCDDLTSFDAHFPFMRRFVVDNHPYWYFFRISPFEKLLLVKVSAIDGVVNVRFTTDERVTLKYMKSMFDGRRELIESVK